MKRKVNQLTTNGFIEKAKLKHGDKYDYSLVDYKNNRTKVKILCSVHGVFEQRPDAHFSGQGCLKCHISNITKTDNDFIEKANLIHGEYAYSLVKYKNDKTKVKIICKKHGIFEQTPNSHLNGSGCPNCSFSDSFKNVKSFIYEATLIHGEYDYSLVELINCKIKVKIICKKHGIFEQAPSNHLQGTKCPMCSIHAVSNTDTFSRKGDLIHGNIYDYTLSKYINCDTKVKIICEKHGIFEQTPYQHINRGNGCPVCKESIGERKIRIFLIEHNINFNRQKRFDNCKHIRPLPFDFYLTDFNICVEYDGEQHDKLFRFEKDDSKLKIRKIRDKIKTEFCLSHNIKLLRINYKENITNKLKENIKLC